MRLTSGRAKSNAVIPLIEESRLIMRTIFFIIFFSIQVNYFYCQNLIWEPVAKLLGGRINDLSLINNERLILANDSNILCYNKDGSWQNLPQKKLEIPIKYICVSKKNSIFALKDSSYLNILRSGSSYWEKTSLYLNNPTSIIYTNNNIIYISDEDKVFCSKDDGEYWNCISNGLDITDSNYEDYYGEDLIEFKILSLCADSAGNIYAGSNNYGIFKLNSNDSIWTQLGDEFLYHSTNCEIKSLWSSNKNILYAGTDGYGIFRSTDSGKTWIKIYKDPEEYYLSINHLIGDNKGYLYAGTNRGLMLSDDAGRTWQNRIDNLSLSSITSIVIDKNNVISIGTDDSGVFELNSANTSFKQIGVPIDTKLTILDINEDAKQNIYFTCRNHGVYIYSKGDLYWRKILYSKGENNFRTLGNDSSGNLLVGGYSGHVYRAKDCGQKWDNYSGNFTIGSIDCFGKNRKGDLFVGNASGIVTTSDDGKTWRRLKVPLEPIVTRIFFDSLGSMFITTWSDGPQLSTDNGLTWIQLRDKIEKLNLYPDQFFEQLRIGCFAFNENNIPFVGTYEGIYKSLDNGRSWNKLFWIKKDLVLDIIPLSLGKLIVATAKSGIFYSNDNGLIWSSLNSGLNSLNISKMMKSSSGYIYLATEDGIYKSSNSVNNIFK